ncbi:MAG: GNAT family N-acetyltransferase [Promethearchaeota archaeon]
MAHIEVFTFKEGNNIDLVPLNTEHAKLYQKWRNHPIIRKYLIEHLPTTLEAIKKWINPQQEGLQRSIFFEIWHKKDKKPVGIAGLDHINWFYRWSTTYIFIGEREYWNQNIATESLKLLLEYGFNELNLNKMNGWINVENKASLRVAEKAGLTFEARVKQLAYIDGKYMDVNFYGILKDDWINKENRKI